MKDTKFIKVVKALPEQLKHEGESDYDTITLRDGRIIFVDEHGLIVFNDAECMANRDGQFIDFK
jgi:hypothetical protein